MKSFKLQFKIDSLAGAAFSKKVSENYKGEFIFFHKLLYIIVYACLTVRSTNQTETTVGYNDPLIFYGRVSAYGITGTLGITG